MLKLSDSLPEAADLAAKDSGCCKAGANGWVTVKFDAAVSPPLDVLARWIDESYRLLAPKKLTALLPERAAAMKKPKGTASRKESQKKT